MVYLHPRINHVMYYVLLLLIHYRDLLNLSLIHISPGGRRDGRVAIVSVWLRCAVWRSVCIRGGGWWPKRRRKRSLRGLFREIWHLGNSFRNRLFKYCICHLRYCSISDYYSIYPLVSSQISSEITVEWKTGYTEILYSRFFIFLKKRGNSFQEWK